MQWHIKTFFFFSSIFSASFPLQPKVINYIQILLLLLLLFCSFYNFFLVNLFHNKISLISVFDLFAARNIHKSCYKCEIETKEEDLNPMNDDSVYHLDYTPPKKNRPVHN